MRIIRHILIVTGALLVLVGIPVWSTGYIQGKLSGADVISSATVVIEQPSGAYVVIINKDFHHDEENLEIWKNFFGGEEIDFLFEDISCVVADCDAAGLELAKSFQSRLPENQMSIRIEDITLMLSKADYGKFDVIVMSKEVYDAYSAQTVEEYEQSVVLEEEGQ
ncbi:MAG: hypothetical protein K5900_09030 [Butyrivibrio sp.]|nr:hypothetical protein [Butyrivibrio sp.]